MMVDDSPAQLTSHTVEPRKPTSLLIDHTAGKAQSAKKKNSIDLYYAWKKTI